MIDPRTLQPLDEDALVESVKKTNRVVVAHEAVTRMGFGAEVTAVLQYQAFDYLDAPIERVGAKFAPLAVRAGDGAVRRPARRTTCSLRSSAPWGSNGGERGQAPAPRPGHGGRDGQQVAEVARASTVAKGEPLFEVDTDKVTQEVESDFAGVLLKIVLAAGEAPVGQTIAWIGEAGEEVAEPKLATPDPEPAKPAQEPESAPAPEPAASSSTNGGRIKASPLARRIARERGIDLARAPRHWP